MFSTIAKQFMGEARNHTVADTPQNAEEPVSKRWLPPLIHWGVTLAPLGLAGLVTTISPWLLPPLGAAVGLYWLGVTEPWRTPVSKAAGSVRQRVAVIGAGPSGVTSLKEFVAAGHDVTCFEESHEVGGVFTRTYDGAQLTSSPPTTVFSDFPAEPGEYEHWSKEEYVAYLNRYVDHFQLRGKIRFKNLLKDARYDDELGGWLLEISTGTKSITEGPFDTLVVCTGQNRTPNLPQTDLSGFTGEVLHSARYQNPARFAGKRVVVVGIGETSADIVADIAAVADTCTLSARNGAYVIPRINPRTGEPNDFDSNRLRYALPKWAHNLAVTVCDRAYARWGASGREARRRVALLGETKLAKPFRQFATKSDRFIKMIEAGQCQMAKGFVGFTPNGIRTQDNREIPADVVVFATGYRASGWKFFSDENLPTCPSHFWRMMYTSSYQEKLAFIGFVRPSIGSVPPVAELQARYAARIASGDVKLPDRTTQLHDIERRKQARLASFDNQRLALLVDWIPFMDTLADQIGCRPNLRGLLRKPSLLWRVSTGPMVAAQYRLLGPDATPELAAETLESLPPGMRLRDKLWFFAIHALLSMGAPFEALPSRREYRACTLI